MISPLGLVAASAAVKLRQGAGTEQLLVSRPVVDTTLRLLPASALMPRKADTAIASHEPRTRAFRHVRVPYSRHIMQL